MVDRRELRPFLSVQFFILLVSKEAVLKHGIRRILMNNRTVELRQWTMESNNLGSNPGSVTA